MHARFDDERTAVGKSSFIATNGVLDERTRCEVTVVRARRPLQRSLHREAACAWITISILDHQSDS
jgi:hypothetical protein